MYVSSTGYEGGSGCIPTSQVPLHAQKNGYRSLPPKGVPGTPQLAPAALLALESPCESAAAPMPAAIPPAADPPEEPDEPEEAPVVGVVVDCPLRFWKKSAR